jgi:hypothetical protein
MSLRLLPLTRHPGGLGMCAQRQLGAVRQVQRVGDLGMDDALWAMSRTAAPMAVADGPHNLNCSLAHVPCIFTKP